MQMISTGLKIPESIGRLKKSMFKSKLPMWISPILMNSLVQKKDSVLHP